MPIYEYECKECGILTEYTKKMSEPDPKKCQDCGQDTLQKVISLPAFHLKGGGWYTDAYDGKEQLANKKKAESSAAASSSETAPSKDTASATGGEAKSKLGSPKAESKSSAEK